MMGVQKLGRLDFVITPVEVDGESRRVKIRIEPNPDRYKYIVGSCVPGFIDSHTNMLIPESFMLEAISRMGVGFGGSGMYFHTLQPSINSLPPYSRKRRMAIARQIDTGEYQAPEEQAKIHSELEVGGVKKNIAFLSVDICRSTILRKQNQASFDKSMEIFNQELATLVGQYNGAVLKFTGDGFIAYIDYPAFTLQVDAIAELGLAMLYHLQSCVNPTLRERGLIELSIKIGMEFGVAKVGCINIPAIRKTQLDFVSNALSRAVKVQESCAVNEIRIGQGLRDLMHDKYLRRTCEVDFDGGSVGIENYRVYRIS